MCEHKLLDPMYQFVHAVSLSTQQGLAQACLSET